MQPLGSLIQRISLEVDGKAPKKDLPIIGKISFGGDLSLSDEDERQDYKGRLFWAAAGQLVYSKIRVKQGSFCLVPNSLPLVAVSAEYPVYEIDANKADPAYIDLLLRSAHMKAVLEGLSHGGGTKTRIHPDQFEALLIPVPPLPDQQAIVAQWQKLQARVLDAQRIATQCEETARDVFLAALGLHTNSSAQSRKCFALKWSSIGRWGIETNQPDAKLDVSAGHYPITTLATAILDLANGWSPKCLDRPAEGSEWGVVKLGAVSYGAFDPAANKGLPASLTPQPSLEIKTGDWLISRANITRLVGACALVGETPPRLMLCDKIFRAVWRANSPVLPAYLDEVIKTPHLRQQIEASLTGTSPTMKNISKPALLALRFPLPPLEVQQALITAIGKARADALALRQQAKQLREQAKLEIEAALLGQV
jgi:type I restriction enzyme S subunit